jgi:hypothetical protein
VTDDLTDILMNEKFRKRNNTSVFLYAITFKPPSMNEVKLLPKPFIAQ